MADFEYKGSNNLGAFDMYAYRSLYRSSVLPANSSEALSYIKDFWYVENLFYGRVNPFYNVVQVNPNYLKTVDGSSPSRIRVLDFVRNAFTDFRREYNRRAEFGNRRGDSASLIDMIPKKGYVDPSKAYEKYASQVYYDFVDIYLDEVKSIKIHSFDAFMKEFMNYLGIRDKKMNSPITKSAFLASSRMSPMITGLCISIADQSHSEDRPKVEDFTGDPDFDFYSQLASKFGFMVDKNAPWRLIANVNSPEMLAYSSAQSTDASDVAGLFNRFYITTFSKEFDLLRTQFLQTYNTFIDANPIVKKYYYKNCCINIETIVRQPLTREEFDLKYGMDYWFKKYAQIKNLETKYGYTESELNSIAKNANDLNNKFDTLRALGYINRKFKAFAHRTGSLFYNIQKINAVSEGRLDTDIREEACHAARKTRTILY